MASALALQCSTDRSYEDPYVESRPVYRVHLLKVTGMARDMKLI